MSGQLIGPSFCKERCRPANYLIVKCAAQIGDYTLTDVTHRIGRKILSYTLGQRKSDQEQCHDMPAIFTTGWQVPFQIEDSGRYASRPLTRELIEDRNEHETHRPFE